MSSEHGLALWVEVGDAGGELERFLLDTGQHPATLAANAARAGVSLCTASAVVLSHGHYDHTGGLPALASAGVSCPVFLGVDAERGRFSAQVGVGADGRRMIKPIGLPSPGALASLRVSRVSGVARVSPRLTLFSLPVPAPPNVRLLAADGRSADTFSDEVFALVSDGAKVMLFGGCTHHGLPLLLRYVFAELGVPRVDCFVGGLHLQGRTLDDVRAVADVAAAYDVRSYALLHCTGDLAREVWRGRFNVTDGFDFRL